MPFTILSARRDPGVSIGPLITAIYILIAAAKLDDINPQASLVDVLRWIADYPASRLHELLP
jgi:transposase